MASLRWIFLPLAFALFGAPAQQSSGTIVFVHAPDGSGPWPVEDIYAMDADGANVRALTTDGHSHDPVWSPDAKRVLFVHDSALQTTPPHREQTAFASYHAVELYEMDRDGGNRHLLRRMEPVIYSAAWSPDGKTIAISSAGVGLVRAGLFLLPADAQGEPRLLFPEALTPSWSPDGKKLAFSVERPRGQWAVHVANRDGSNDAQLTEPPLIAGSPAWSPDGKLIAYDELGRQRDEEIFVMNADGSEQRQITTTAGWSCMHPSWSADGRRLVFSCRSTSGCSGGIASSAGIPLPECSRRIFTVSPFDSDAKPIQLSDRDGAGPEVAPIQ